MTVTGESIDNCIGIPVYACSARGAERVVVVARRCALASGALVVLVPSCGRCFGGRNQFLGPTDQSDSWGAYSAGRTACGKGRKVGWFWRYTCSLTLSLHSVTVVRFL